MLLAGDIGGTKTLVGLFERAAPRPVPAIVRTYITTAFGSFSEILDAFEHDAGTALDIEAAAVGVAGPVVDQHAQLTNIEWNVSADEIRARCGVTHARVLNDLEALASSVGVLAGSELLPLQPREPHPHGNAVVIAAGTGLGQAYLHRVDGRLHPVATEGGHADFAARTDREAALVRMLRGLYGRAEVEHVLSGPGLVNLHRFTHEGAGCPAIPVVRISAARISEAALSGACTACEEALDLFVSAYGAETGNLALRGIATSGVFIGGGIAPKILPRLERGDFMAAFLEKAPMTELLASMPVHLILNAEAALVGAAVVAARLANTPLDDSR